MRSDIYKHFRLSRIVIPITDRCFLNKFSSRVYYNYEREYSRMA